MNPASAAARGGKPLRPATLAGMSRSPGEAKIAKRRFIRREEDKGKSLRINERVRISPVRLIDQDNEQVGIIETDRAREMAREAGLDLVEVAPNVRPPVCRIMDYGKWKYQQRKKEQKAKSHAKQSELKEVRLRPGTDEHDMTIKMDRARDFLEEGHKVQFTMMFRGRQMAHKNIGFRNFEQIADSLADIAKVEVAPRSMGRRMTMTVAPLPRSERKAKPAESEEREKEGEPQAPEDRSSPEPPPTHQSPNI